MDKKANDQVLRLTNRTRLELNDVNSVAAFDEEYIALEMTDGKIYIDGEGLRIIDLSKESGKIVVTGRVNDISYTDNKERKKRGLFR